MPTTGQKFHSRRLLEAPQNGEGEITILGNLHPESIGHNRGNIGSLPCYECFWNTRAGKPSERGAAMDIDCKEITDCFYGPTEKEQTDPAIEEAIVKSLYRPEPFTGERPKYEILALKWGEMPNEPGYLHFFLGDPPMTPEQNRSPLNVYMWLIRGDGRTVLFDVDTTPEGAKNIRITNYQDRDEVFAKVDCRLSDIDSIMISHTHADHYQAISEYRKCDAYLYMSEVMFRWTVQYARRYPFLRMAGVPSLEDVHATLAFLNDGLCRIVPGKQWEVTEIEPGISVMRVDGHAPGQQVLIVNTEKGPVVLAGDSIFRFRNLDEEYPGGIVTACFTDNMNVYPRLKQLVKDGGFIVPSHEKDLADRYTEIKPGVIKIA